MIHYFPTLYINLTSRPDRRVLAEKEFAKHGIITQRVEAVKGNPGIETTIIDGHVGCVLSHIKCITKAKENHWSSVLIFEDDVELTDNFKELFNLYLMDVPHDWDMIYLGGNHWGRDLKQRYNPQLERITDRVYKTKHTLTTHAYIIKDTMYDRTIELFSGMGKEVDVMYITLQQEFNVYTFRPSLAWQRADVSDINHKQCDYSFIKEW